MRHSHPTARKEAVSRRRPPQICFTTARTNGAGVVMTNFGTRWQATEQVLALVARTRDTLAKINAASVNTAKGVFQHPATQLAALKAARENIEKAIEIMQARYKD